MKCAASFFAMCVVLVFTTSAQTAVIDVGYTLSTESSFQQDGADYVDAIESNNGQLPDSPEEIDVNKIIDPDVLFFGFTITREENEDSEIKLDNVRFDQSSDDDANWFANAGSFAGVDYSAGDDLLGLQYGPDNELFTDDDIVLSDGSTNADFIGVFAQGQNFANNEANRTYFNDETPFEVETTVELVESFEPNPVRDSGSETVTVAGDVAIPEPTSIVLLGIGSSLILFRRRRNHTSFLRE